MNIYVLRDDNQMYLLHQVLGILEILQPQVFDDAYKAGLHSTLQCYFELLKYHEPVKDVYSIMCLFMDFLQSYMHANATSALQFIELHAELIQYLSANYKRCISLRQLVQGVSLLKHRTDTRKTVDDKETVEEDEEMEFKPLSSSTSSSAVISSDTSVTLFPYTKSFLAHPQWNHLETSLLKIPQTDDIASILEDIESITLKRPGLLDSIFEKLLELLFSPNPNARSISHKLLVRHLKTRPGNCFVNQTVLAAYIKCLQHEDIGITASALECLTEMVICLQEYSSEILMTVFELGISSKINTSAQIKRCVSTLKMQHAC